MKTCVETSKQTPISNKFQDLDLLLDNFFSSRQRNSSKNFIKQKITGGTPLCQQIEYNDNSCDRLDSQKQTLCKKSCDRICFGSTETPVHFFNSSSDEDPYKSSYSIDQSSYSKLPNGSLSLNGVYPCRSNLSSHNYGNQSVNQKTSSLSSQKLSSCDSSNSMKEHSYDTKVHKFSNESQHHDLLSSPNSDLSRRDKYYQDKISITPSRLFSKKELLEIHKHDSSDSLKKVSLSSSSFWDKSYHPFDDRLKQASQTSQQNPSQVQVEQVYFQNPFIKEKDSDKMSVDRRMHSFEEDVDEEEDDIEYLKCIAKNTNKQIQQQLMNPKKKVIIPFMKMNSDRIQFPCMANLTSILSQFRDKSSSASNDKQNNHEEQQTNSCTLNRKRRNFFEDDNKMNDFSLKNVEYDELEEDEEEQLQKEYRFHNESVQRQRYVHTPTKIISHSDQKKTSSAPDHQDHSGQIQGNKNISPPFQRIQINKLNQQHSINSWVLRRSERQNTNENQLKTTEVFEGDEEDIIDNNENQIHTKKKYKKERIERKIVDSDSSDTETTVKRSNRLINESKSYDIAYEIREKKIKKKLIKSSLLEEREQLTCSICLENPKGCHLGKIDCGHNFCFSCIHNWSKVTNQCPMCRKEFLKIAKFTFSGSLSKDHPYTFVRRKKQRVNEEDYIDEAQALQDEENLAAAADQEPSFCYKCSNSDRENLLLVCDVCDENYCHTFCDERIGNHVVPEGRWACHQCRY